MRISASCLGITLALAATYSGCHAFTVPSGIRQGSFVARDASPFLSHPSHSPSSQKSYKSSSSIGMIGGFFQKDTSDTDTDEDLLPLVDDACRLTPEGFGFSSPASRIVKLAGRNGGYYRATADESVLDVISAITDGKFDIALVYQKDTERDDDLIGIFTETDYIRVGQRSCGTRKFHSHNCHLFCHTDSQFGPLIVLVFHSASRASQFRGGKCQLPRRPRQGLRDIKEKPHYHPPRRNRKSSDCCHEKGRRSASCHIGWIRNYRSH